MLRGVLLRAALDRGGGDLLLGALVLFLGALGVLVLFLGALGVLVLFLGALVLFLGALLRGPLFLSALTRVGLKRRSLLRSAPCDVVSPKEASLRRQSLL